EHRHIRSSNLLSSAEFGFVPARVTTSVRNREIQNLEHKPLLHVVLLTFGWGLGPAGQVAWVRFDGDRLSVGLAVYRQLDGVFTGLEAGRSAATALRTALRAWCWGSGWVAR